MKLIYIVVLIAVFTDRVLCEDKVEEETVIEPPESTNATNSTDSEKPKKKKKDPL